MPVLPAFCENCGYVFPGFDAPQGMNNTFADNFTRCPRCGSTTARVLEGTMNTIGDTIQILRGTNATPGQLARLQEVLRNAQQKQQTPEEVAAAVERAGFGALAKQLLVPRTPADFYAFLTLLITLLKDPQAPTVYEDRRLIVNQTIEQPHKQATAPAAKHGRNEPCPCGSGKKYKHCCGKLK